MKRARQGALLLIASLGLALAANGISYTQEAVKGREVRPKDGTDDLFVFQASAGGLAEVKLGTLAARNASDPGVKRFADRMVTDHSKANTELANLANKAKLKVASRMDDEHEKALNNLLKLSGTAFDREYVAGQVKDHEATVALFEQHVKGGKNQDIKNWADKTLPTLRDHLKMARDLRGKLKEGKNK